MKKEDIVWYEHSREAGTGALTCVVKKADNHQKYRRYREEPDGANSGIHYTTYIKRKGGGEQQIATLEESTESEPKSDAKAMGSSRN